MNENNGATPSISGNETQTHLEACVSSKRVLILKQKIYRLSAKVYVITVLLIISIVIKCVLGSVLLAL